MRTIDAPAGAQAIAWDGRNESGSVVPAGVYVIRANGTEQALTTTVRVLR